ncbi:lipid A export permease/ATP-binding protein MsbA [Marinospirillum insulare]|uniref:Lipid A export ATP-binding/permease protein MsbA n=1 Tax=Marinospirillum insulare TaxID=217169 RepID=A0ABQ6A3C1_9GAMM|nr:lipid A export permease/ATP-binding protein MsbA [Marinospirillum insulare]GLR64683.1 lipid A export ATP-binding/permease protein MsbA [Marinospirillum insulare]
MNQTQTSKQAPTGLNAYLRLLSYVRPYWPAFILSVLGYALYAASSTAFAQVMKLLVDSIQDGMTEKRLFFPLLVVGIFALRGVGTFFGTYFMTYVARQLIHYLRLDLFKRFLVLPAGFYDKHSSGHLVSRLTFNVEQVTGAATNAITVLVREGLFVVGLMGYLLWVNWKLALVFVAVSPVIGLVVSYASKRFRRLSHRIQNSMGDVTHVASETLQGYRVVRSFGGTEFEYQRFLKASEYNRAQAMKMALTKAINTPVVQTIVAIALGILVWLALSPDLMGEMTPGEFIAFLTAASLMAKPLRQLTEINNTIQQGLAAAMDVFTYLDAPEEEDKGTKTLERAQGEVSFKKVSFQYAQDKPLALNQVNFTAKPGEMIALVGRSGGGKSTLANLIPRFYNATQGEIQLDGLPITELTLASLREQIALVTQQVTLFNDTLAANIAYGIKDPDPKAIEAAAKAAFVMDFAEKLPEGLNTLVGDNGVLLSGGQRQRIAIARAIMKDAPILILDEATSALDTESERFIQQALEEVMQGRTSFVIAHRLSTIEQADRILVIDQGQIVEEGNHQELLALNGAYAQLHQLQFHEQIQPEHE